MVDKDVSLKIPDPVLLQDRCCLAKAGLPAGGQLHKTILFCYPADKLLKRHWRNLVVEGVLKRAARIRRYVCIFYEFIYGGNPVIRIPYDGELEIASQFRLT